MPNKVTTGVEMVLAAITILSTSFTGHLIGDIVSAFISYTFVRLVWRYYGIYIVATVEYLKKVKSIIWNIIKKRWQI